MRQEKYKCEDCGAPLEANHADDGMLVIAPCEECGPEAQAKKEESSSRALARELSEQFRKNGQYCDQ
jgi:DNA-directed RNA polymerase subunit RPC12/RpoP